jgi:Fe-S oxidoreductase
MGAFREIKRIFDPKNLLNPGNIVDLGGNEPRPIDSIAQKLRVEPAPGRPTVIPRGTETYFDYTDQHGFDGAVEMCNGAGVCRKKQGGTMCPSYMATLDERHSTRGRGNALRLAITGQLDVGSGKSDVGAGGWARSGSDIRHPTSDMWNDPGTIETLNLCLSCKACKTECPSNVDIARLKAEYTAQRYKHGHVPLRARLFGAVRALGRSASGAPGLANWMAGSMLGRRLASDLMGIDPRRSMPAFSAPLSRLWPNGRGRPDGAPRVAFFGDCFTMYNEPGIGLATLRVFRAGGYQVQLADAGCCGRAKISTGLLPQAIEEIEATLQRLRPLIDDNDVKGILVAEPSCLSAIKDDWLALNLRSPIKLRRQLAAKAFLPEDFIDRFWDQHPQRPKFRASTRPIVLHGHCHQKALWGAETSARALRRGAQQVTVLDSGCCGMAGSFGFTRDRYDVSMKIGELVLFPAVRAAGEDAVICAPGTSCRHQIHDGTGVRALHPMEVLAGLIEPVGAAARA